MDQIVKFVEAIFPDQFTAIIVVVMVVVLFWIYKELKSNYIDKIKAKQLKIEQILKAYMDLDLEIDNYLIGQANFSVLIKSFSDNSIVLPYEAIERYQKLKTCTEEITRRKLLEDFQKEFQAVALNLKNHQENSSLGSNKVDALQNVVNYARIYLSPLIMPMIQTLICFLLLLVFASIILALQTNNDSIMVQIQILSILFAFIIFNVVALTAVNEGLFKNRFKKPWIDGLILVVYIALSIYSLTLTKFLFNGLLIILLTFAYSFVLNRWSLKSN